MFAHFKPLQFAGIPVLHSYAINRAAEHFLLGSAPYPAPQRVLANCFGHLFLTFGVDVVVSFVLTFPFSLFFVMV